MKPQLLAPAGNLEKLKWAVKYGADAVYFGMKFGSLRNFAGNFSLQDAQVGLDFLHQNGKKGYVTLNIYPFSDEYEKLIETAKKLDDIGVDAFIVADMGVLAELNKLGLSADIHISTQANTVSFQTAMAYKQLGAKRVNLARELSLEKIIDIQKNLAGQIETEVFIHGSVCFSYSGRCAISDYLTAFRANHGECKHPCRWKYFLVEEKRPGVYLPVTEDDRGTYIFNSKELALFDYMPRLIEAGVMAFKIEGRMKSIHYIASVVSFYRRLLDGETFTEKQAYELLNRVPNRGYCQGFMKGNVGPEDYEYAKNESKINTVFVGNVTGEKINSQSVLEVRNKIFAGETLEVLTPDGNISQVTMSEPLVNTKNQQLEEVNNNEQFLLLQGNWPEYSIFRRLGVIFAR
jgi:putative protease